MTNKLVNGLEKKSNNTETQNGRKAYKSTLNNCLDFFSSVGALRNDPKKALDMFVKAYIEDKETSLKLALWSRDIRGGAGERNIFRNILKWLDKHDPTFLIDSNFLYSVIEVGRWDDIYVIENDKVRDKIALMLSTILQSDNPGLAAKWTSRQKDEAKWLRKKLELDPKTFRKLLVENSKTVEQLMSSNKWGEIVYEHVPSKASIIYRKAFEKNDNNRYKLYKEKLSKGETKINAGALYPHDITSKINFYDDNTILEAQWKSLPNYVENDNTKAIVVCDVSGSMTWNKISQNIVPLDIAVSLAIYTANRLNGPFKNCAITFDSIPEFIKFSGDLISDVRTAKNAPWGGSTNIDKVFELILKTAIKNKVDKKDMPTHIVIISDMQFDCGKNTVKKTHKADFENAGYDLPAIVFWNVDYKGNKPAKFDTNGVMMVSGFSPSILKNVLNMKPIEEVNPLQLMFDTLQDPRYTW